MRRRATMAITLTLESSRGWPLQEQVYRALKKAIESGRLKPHERLPSSRALARQLNVARNTVSAALEALTGDGLLVTKRGSGSQVATTVQKQTLTVRTSGVASVSKRAAALAAVKWPEQALLKGYAFRLGVPALDAFPTGVWERLTHRVWSRGSSRLLGDFDRRGYAPLREAVADYVSVARGVAASADQVLIVAGAQQGFSLLGKVLLDPGDVALVEDPGYLGSLHALVAAGARPKPMPVDDDGAQFDVRAGVGARVMVITPSNQFPLGVRMSEPRRAQVLEWARTRGGYIIEDDYDGEFRYVTQPLPSLAACDPERVILVGSFSKVLAPSLRLGYVVVPQALVDSMLAAKVAEAGRTPMLEQAVTYEFVASGQFQRHVRRMRELYDERQRRLTELVAHELPAARLRRIDAGMQAVLELPARVRALQVSEQARREGLTVAPLSAFTLEAKVPEALVLGFAALGAQEMTAAVRSLAGVVRDALKQGA